MPPPPSSPPPHCRSDARALSAQLRDAEPALRAFVRRLVGCAADAEDVLQDALARAWRYRDTYRSEQGSPLVWLRQTAFRCVLDQRARRGRRPERALARPEQLAREDRAQQGIDDREQLRTVLAALPAVERDVLLRFHRDGASIDQIGRELGMPAGTVKSHLHRARRRAREAWPEEDV